MATICTANGKHPVVNRGAAIGRYHFGSLKWIGITNRGGSMRRLVMFVLTGLFVAPAALVAQTAPCRIVTITGSQGGPGLCNGLAGSGTLVRYGDESDKCLRLPGKHCGGD